MMRGGVARVDGIAGAPFTIYYGEVSGDSDGPVEFCWPVPGDQAAEIAARFPDLTLRTEPAPDRQAQTLAALAWALAEANQHEQGETVARSITDLNKQTQALIAVAKALVARRDTRQAHHVAAAACAVGQWITVLELVLSCSHRR